MPTWAAVAAYGLLAFAVWSGATVWLLDRRLRRDGHDPDRVFEPAGGPRRIGVLMYMNLAVPALVVVFSRGAWMALAAAFCIAAVALARLTVRRWDLRLANHAGWIACGGTAAMLSMVALPLD